MKTDYNTLQLKTTELQGELSEAKENLSVADMEFQKLENRMEVCSTGHEMHVLNMCFIRDFSGGHPDN